MTLCQWRRVGIRVKTNMLKAGQWIFAYQHVWKHPDMLPKLTGPRAQSKVHKDMLWLTLPSAPSGPRTHQGYLDLINALQMDGRSRSSQKHFYPDRGAGSAGPMEPRGGARPHPSTTHPLANPKKKQIERGWWFAPRLWWRRLKKTYVVYATSHMVAVRQELLH